MVSNLKETLFVTCFSQNTTWTRYKRHLFNYIFRAIVTTVSLRGKGQPSDSAQPTSSVGCTFYEIVLQFALSTAEAQQIQHDVKLGGDKGEVAG